MFDRLPQDLRFTARMIRRNPGFSAVAIATLALGIGANTAIFSVVDHVMLRPLTYKDANRLVAIQEAVPEFSNVAPVVPVNAMHFYEWKKHARSFEDLALIGGMTLNMTGWCDPQRIPSARVTWNLFQMLGVHARIGRTFLPEADHPGRDQVVVISDELWRQRFASDTRVVGKTIRLNDSPYRIIGVLPAGFHFPKLSRLFAMSIAEERPLLWKPFALRDDELDALGDFNYACIARLKPGVSVAKAVSELDVIDASITKQLPEKVEFRALAFPLRDQITSRSRAGLEFMLLSVAAVLL